MTPETRTVFVAIVGCPNVGKSSILNRLLGQKVAIVTRRPQTTRTKITGVLTRGATQFVFTDTPGLHRPKTRLGEKMMHAAHESLNGVDVCLLVTEPKGSLRAQEEEMLTLFREKKTPLLLAINKVDALESKALVLERIAQFSELFPFAAIIPVSALRGDNMDALLTQMEQYAVPSVHFFPDDTLTDQPERILAAEFIREKLLLLLNQEIPHEIAVITQSMREREDGLLEIQAIVYCGNERHKGIIIGKQGAKLKQASTLARQELEHFFGCQVHLRCFVKVKEGWRDKASLLHEFGLDGSL